MNLLLDFVLHVLLHILQRLKIFQTLCMSPNVIFLTATKSYKQVNNTKDPNFLQLHVLSTIKIACIGLPFALTTKTNNIACLKYHLQFFAVNLVIPY